MCRHKCANRGWSNLVSTVYIRVPNTVKTEIKMVICIKRVTKKDKVTLFLMTNMAAHEILSKYGNTENVMRIGFPID